MRCKIDFKIVISIKWKKKLIEVCDVYPSYCQEHADMARKFLDIKANLVIVMNKYVYGEHFSLIEYRKADD